MDTTGKHITAPGWDDVLAACLKTTSPVENGDTCEAREVSAWRKKFENFDSHSPKSTSETTLFEHQKVVKVLGAAICLQAQRGRCKSI